MKQIYRTAAYITSVLILATASACTDEERGSLSLAPTEENITFRGTVENGKTASRAPIPMNSTDNNYGDIYIYQQVDNESNIQIYTVSSGEQGRLETKPEDGEASGDPLKWQSVDAEHTFYAWTQPHPANTNGSTGGVKMDEAQAPMAYATTGTVTFGTQEETDLEKFIVVKTGPLTYSEQNQYVGLHFYHPIGKIQLDSITHVRSDGSKEDIQTATLTFPNLPKSAVFNVLNASQTPYTDVLTANDEEGITWKWTKDNRGSGATREGNAQLYVFPFTFAEDGKADYEQPGYFTVEIDVTDNSSSASTTHKIYSGTLAGSTNPSKLEGNQIMHIGMQVADGGGTGIYSYIKDWDTSPAKDVPQHRVPGIYTQADAQALLNALQNGTEIPSYLIDTEGDTQTIRFFTHVDWSKATGNITIPEDYVLDGQGYNLTLPKDVNLYGVKGEGEDEAGNIKHLYVNGDEYTVVEEPDPDTEPDEGTGEDGTGGTGNPDAGTTPRTPGTEAPAEDTANT